MTPLESVRPNVDIAGDKTVDHFWGRRNSSSRTALGANYLHRWNVLQIHIGLGRHFWKHRHKSLPHWNGDPISTLNGWFGQLPEDNWATHNCSQPLVGNESAKRTKYQTRFVNKGGAFVQPSIETCSIHHLLNDLVTQNLVDISNICMSLTQSAIIITSLTWSCSPLDCEFQQSKPATLCVQQSLPFQRRKATLLNVYEQTRRRLALGSTIDGTVLKPHQSNTTQRFALPFLVTSNFCWQASCHVLMSHPRHDRETQNCDTLKVYLDHS